MYKLKYCILIL